MTDMRGPVAVILALCVAGILGAGAWRWIVSPGHPTEVQTVTLAATVGALIGALSTYLGSTPLERGHHAMTEDRDDDAGTDIIGDDDTDDADPGAYVPGAVDDDETGPESRQD